MLYLFEDPNLNLAHSRLLLVGPQFCHFVSCISQFIWKKWILMVINIKLLSFMFLLLFVFHLILIYIC